MSEGVEWALHCCLTLGWLGGDRPVSTAKLAATFELPSAYLNKHLQALARAGILASSPGARGGFRLGRPAEKITLLDVVMAIEGREWAFRCTEIRQRGAGADRDPQDFARQCAITTGIRKAEMAWRRELASQTLADMMARAPAAAVERTRQWYAV
ncbi:RrF2 family transcriptional regulator [Actinoallomurus rhizosphaericola]|uniref:RrF2 family transcriptional regulator n=1 Tax=Actinoallomurus rhizosphaericola TaxID=2952536 RepID=UPI002092A4E4|nr:Rrf2 family transcriptional regulator [Actinoallomurus rhizosphaericola]MCO5998838.1 Rrf2 family transcriptional regulator [Actinoallomurus rhizosphaericola]